MGVLLKGSHQTGLTKGILTKGVSLTKGVPSRGSGQGGLTGVSPKGSHQRGLTMGSHPRDLIHHGVKADKQFSNFKKNHKQCKRVWKARAITGGPLYLNPLGINKKHPTLHKRETGPINNLLRVWPTSCPATWTVTSSTPTTIHGITSSHATTQPSKESQQNRYFWIFQSGFLHTKRPKHATLTIQGIPHILKIRLVLKSVQSPQP